MEHKSEAARPTPLKPHDKIIQRLEKVLSLLREQEQDLIRPIGDLGGLGEEPKIPNEKSSDDFPEILGDSILASLVDRTLQIERAVESNRVLIGRLNQLV